MSLKPEMPKIAVHSVAELCDQVVRSSQERMALFPVGGGTMLDMGALPREQGKWLDVTPLNRLVDYPARDMTITVQAGMTLKQLETILAKEHQQLPIDVPLPDKATLGGAIATNSSGMRRFGYGTFRDYIIGMSLVNNEGQEVKAGGRVVKNVAGYDLMKLNTGALGTLGIISQVTLKVKPLPEAACWVRFGCKSTELAEQLDRLHQTRTRPVGIEVVNRAVASQWFSDVPSTDWLFLIGFEDNAKAVEWQVSQLRDELPASIQGSWHALTAQETKPLVASLRDFMLESTETLSIKANLRPAQVAGFLTRVTSSAPQSWRIQAHAGNGIVLGHYCGEQTLPAAKQLCTEWLTLAGQSDGNISIYRCPAEWKTSLPLWGRSTSDRAMMKTIKQTLDPSRIFNPGRFVDEI